MCLFICDSNEWYFTIYMQSHICFWSFDLHTRSVIYNRLFIMNFMKQMPSLQWVFFSCIQVYLSCSRYLNLVLRNVFGTDCVWDYIVQFLILTFCDLKVNHCLKMLHHFRFKEYKRRLTRYKIYIEEFISNFASCLYSKGFTTTNLVKWSW